MSNHWPTISRRFAAIYLGAWQSAVGENQNAVGTEWNSATEEFTRPEIEAAIARARDKHPDFPPKLGEFLAILRAGIKSTGNTDNRCRFESNGVRCPAWNAGRGYCPWHSESLNAQTDGISILNYLTTHGVPSPLPDWRELMFLLRWETESIEDCRQQVSALESMFRRLPKSPPSTRQAYDDEIAHLRDIDRRSKSEAPPAWLSGHTAAIPRLGAAPHIPR